MKYYTTNNTAPSVRLDEIPVVSYAEFFEDMDRKLGQERYHIGHYFALP